MMRPAAPRHARPQPPTAKWYLETISCRAACPVGTDAAGYVQAIARGEFAQAYDLARAHNPLPSVCARVCSAPCERACRRGVIDAPVAIRALKRVVCEMVGAEAASPPGSASPPRSRWHQGHGAIPRATGPSIGIVGAGPAGLAAAHELRVAGHPVTLYEAGAEAGGMLIAGIPAFRLPREVIRAEIAAILSMGVMLETGCEIGRDRHLDDLLREHAAVLITVGCRRGRTLPIPGAALPGVVSAVEALQAINAGRLSTLRAPVVVVGGGSVAFDAARTARRTATWPVLHTALDAARSAVRSTSTPVTLIAPESRETLPVPSEELHEADQEGVTVRAGYGVRAIVGTDGVEGVVIAPIMSLYDAAGRFQPVLADGRDETLRAATVVLAVGQQSDTTFLDAALGLESTSWRGVRADADGRTSHARLYAAGDVATGPRDLIDAIAAGQRAARAMHHDLAAGGSLAPRKHDARHGDEMVLAPAAMPQRAWTGHDTVSRRVLPVLRVVERQLHDEVEQLLGAMDARREAARCLQCDVNIELDTGRCIACGLCVDVCPYGCIALTPASVDALRESALLALSLDEAACVRCGLCVDRCPPQALSFQRVVTHV